MKAVIAMDSFKGSISSIEAGNAVAEGIQLLINNPSLCNSLVNSLTNEKKGNVEEIKKILDNDFSYLKDEIFNQRGDIKFISTIKNPILSYFSNFLIKSLSFVNSLKNEMRLGLSNLRILCSSFRKYLRGNKDITPLTSSLHI